MLKCTLEAASNGYVLEILHRGQDLKFVFTSLEDVLSKLATLYTDHSVGKKSKVTITEVNS